MAKVTADTLLNEAIAGTEREIFSEALDDRELDNDGDKSLEAMGDGLEGDHVEIDEEADGGEAPADGDADKSKEGDKDATDDGKDKAKRDDDGRFKAKDPEPEPDDDGRIPRGVLREERSKRQAAETEAKALRDEVAAIHAKLDQALAQRPAAPAPTADEATDQEPDPVLDPKGFKQGIREEMTREFTARIVDASFAAAHEEHGEKFEAAYSALTSLNRTDPSDRAAVQRITTAANPGSALMKWHRKQEALRKVGDDPDAWLDRQLDDPAVQARAAERQRAVALGAKGGRPNTITKLPPSLNSASRGGGARSSHEVDADLYDDSEDAVFSHATR